MTNIPLVHIIEGNIGSGKSTLLESLKNKGYTVAPEPVDEWVESGALEEYYKGNMDAFTFQCYILESKVKAFKQVLREWTNGPIFLERGFEADSKVFLKYNVDKGKSTEFQLELYAKLAKEITSSLNCEFGKVLYLDVSPMTCLERIGKRSRTGENSISFDLIRDLHVLYNEFVNEIPTEQKIYINSETPEYDIENMSIF
jgi:deoxyadenosine/deoxycytidine kinase